MKTKNTISFILLLFSTTILCTNQKIEREFMEIKPLQLDQVKEVKRIIVNCAFELWQPKYTIQELERMLDTDKDLINVQASYFDNNGTFLVLLDGHKVVGAGAIKNFDDETCELKRMWFLKEYRGKGFGLRIATQLLEFAKSHGYKKVRLDIYHPEMQAQAIALYRKLGFYEIKNYNNSTAQLFMEKVL
jgi:putative acetyltransferase